jgi:hypothetical protein
MKKKMWNNPIAKLRRLKTNQMSRWKMKMMRLKENNKK